MGEMGEDGEEKAAVSARSRNNYRALVVSLFHFAKAMGYLPANLPTEADGLKKAKDDGGDIEILTCGEM